MYTVSLLDGLAEQINRCLDIIIWAITQQHDCLFHHVNLVHDCFLVS
jgi:hypothetical protein